MSLRVYEKLTVLTCIECGEPFEKETKEVRRRVKAGKTEFFCGTPCATKHRMRESGVTYPTVTRVCPVCGVSFRNSTSPKKSTTYCSRKCSNAPQVPRIREVTDAMRQCGREQAASHFRHDVEHTANVMRIREGWKYADMAEVLTRLGIAHTFEFPLDPFIHDLALHDSKVIIEFDGPDHEFMGPADAYRDKQAVAQGWSVHRIHVDPGKVIPASVLLPFLQGTFPVPRAIISTDGACAAEHPQAGGGNPGVGDDQSSTPSSLTSS